MHPGIIRIKSGRPEDFLARRLDLHHAETMTIKMPSECRKNLVRIYPNDKA